MDPALLPTDITPAEEIAAGITQWCPQCWEPRELSAFISARGRFVNMCAVCRLRYSNWKGRGLTERLAARAPVERTGNGYTVHLTPASANRKTGPIPVSTTDMRSCPPSCSLMDRGCYAGYGKAAFHWREVATKGLTWRAFCAEIAKLPPGTIWRHNEAGDLPGLGEELDTDALARLVGANRGRRGFSFTHKRLQDPDERRAVANAVRDGFMINLSAETLREADRLADLRIAPVAVLLPSDARKATRTPAGRKVVVCPAVTSHLTCATCGLCTKDRAAVIGFPGHGQAAALVTLRAKGRSLES